MPKNKKNKAFIYMLLLCLLYVGGQQRVWGQFKPNCGGIEYPEAIVPPPISLNERVRTASAVFEGRLVNTYYITTEDAKKYTCFVVEVYRIFKGNFVADTVDVVSSVDWDTYRKEPLLNQSLWTYGIGIFFTEPTTKFDACTQSTHKKFQFYSPYYGHIEEFEQIEHPEKMDYRAFQKIQTLHKSIAKYAHKKPKVVKEIYKKN
jgi:hypothetical protein